MIAHKEYWPNKYEFYEAMDQTPSNTFLSKLSEFTRRIKEEEVFVLYGKWSCATLPNPYNQPGTNPRLLKTRKYRLHLFRRAMDHIVGGMP